MSVAPPRVSESRGATVVVAVIVDDAGSVVARRSLTDSHTRACLPLARAVGAWASLVLDAEMNRATDDDGSEASDVQGSSPRRVTNSVGRASVGFSAAPAAPAAPAASAGRGSAATAESSIDHAPSTGERKAPRGVDLGSMVYLRSAMTKSGGVAGLAPFVTVEVASGWVLRPGLFFGRSTAEQEPARLSHVGARVDVCRRIPGNYIERRGLEVDVCGGIEGGAVTASGPGREAQTAGWMAMGPAANLRGQLGAGLALEIRGLVGESLLPSASQAPALFAAGEVGISLRLP